MSLSLLQHPKKSSTSRWGRINITAILMILVVSWYDRTNLIHAKHYETSTSRSFRRLLQNENDGTLLSRTALIDKATELNDIVRTYRQNRRERALYTEDVFNVTTRTDALNGDVTGTTTGGGTDAVYTEERVNEVCDLIERSFHPTMTDTTTSTTNVTGNATEPVTCTCMGSLLGTLSINCDYSVSVCNDNSVTATTRSTNGTTVTSTSSTCGKPQLGVTMVRGYVFSATTCISQYRRGLMEIPDTCVFVNSCEDIYSNTFCDCTASHNGSICSTCSICDGGKSMSVDCTNVNPNAIQTTCQPIDLDLDLSSGAGQILGFIPQFDDGTTNVSATSNDTLSFCTQLESFLQNQVTCDCRAVNGSLSSYEIECSTMDTKCDPNNVNCGIVSSSLQIANGQYNPNIVTTCTKYPDPLGETCTTMNYCNGSTLFMMEDNVTATTNTSDSNATTASSSPPYVCGCQVSYNGNQCSSCSVCNDGNGIEFDCSNVYEYAYSEQCQVVSRASSYEYVPLFATTAKNQSSSSNNNNSTNTTTPIDNGYNSTNTTTPNGGGNITTNTTTPNDNSNSTNTTTANDNTNNTNTTTPNDTSNITNSSNGTSNNNNNTNSTTSDSNTSINTTNGTPNGTTPDASANTKQASGGTSSMMTTLSYMLLIIMSISMIME